MCGIAGGFAFQTDTKYLNNIGKAVGCLQHRGPDGDGVFRDKNVSLGHRRLSIIDISTAANQPMLTDDRRYCIVFNGEIFNYKELQARYLKERNLHTTSDTEVLLELFAINGPECFTELRGFFAAAIYDKEKEELFIVRDRFGKKPVHIYQDDEVLLFASELKSLVAFGIPKKIDYTVLSTYLQLNYVPQPYSILQKVRKLMPGHYLKISKKGKEEKIYFELKVHSDQYQSYTYEQAKKKCVELMDEATRLRLISDVPLGAFLSGGIDSSVVVALASRHKQKLNTFSIGYKDYPFFDETRYADLVAKKYNTEHTVFKLSNNDFLDNIHSVLDAIDEPFADSSAIPMFILCKETRKKVTVALSGDGGDEVFAGYNKHAAEWKMRRGGFMHQLVKWGKPVWSHLPQSRHNKLTNTFRQLNRYAIGAAMSPGDRYWRWASFQTAADSRRLMQAGFTPEIEAVEALRTEYIKAIEGRDFNEVLKADMDLVLLGDMLVKVDIMSMANSLEVRSPFLDQQVVDFAFGLPEQYKIDGRMKKKIVQDAFQPLLPAEIYNRPKHGFEIPLLDWLRKDLWSLIDDDLLKESFVAEQGIFNTTAVQSLKQQLQSSNPGDSHATIWALIVFQHWWKRYMAS